MLYSMCEGVARAVSRSARQTNTPQRSAVVIVVLVVAVVKSARKEFAMRI